MCCRSSTVRGTVRVSIPIGMASSVHTSLLLGLFLGCLAGRSGLELASDTLQIVWHLRVGLEKEQLEISRLVLELDLGAILQNILYGSVGAKELEDLTPMWALNHVETCHQRFLLLRCPGSSSRLQTFAASSSGRFRDCCLPSPFVKN